MLFLSIFLSALLLIVVNLAAFNGGKRGVGTASVVSAAAIFPFLCCLGLILPPLNALLVAITGAACWMAGAQPRRFLCCSLGATAVAYGVVIWLFALPEIRGWQRLEAVYPMESLSDRLAYEDRHSSDADSVYASDSLPIFEARMDDEERRYDVVFRSRCLERLHAGVVQQFINSPGFGVGRQIMRPAPFGLEGELGRESRSGPFAPIPQPTPPSALSDLTVETPTAGGADLVGFHVESAVTFLDPLGFGYMRDRDHVAGFRPHQFRLLPEAPQRWQVERLELIGLLKYNGPIAYVSNDLPKMDELRDAPTRPLDAFEQEALAALQQGEDLMVEHRPNRMRMLGSLRAAKQCLRCHQASRGQLLGAFSYKLGRDGNRE